MPTYSIQAPDGRTYEIEGPPGATQEQVAMAVLAQYPDAATPATPEGGFIPAAKAGFESLKGDVALLGGKLGLMSEQEAEAYQKAREAEAARIFKPTEEGWLESPWQKLKETAGGSAAYMAAPLAAGAAAALAPVTAPTAAVLGAGAAGLTSLAQFTGSNLARQMDTGKSLEEADLGRAALAAVPQAALDTLSMRMIPGIGKLLGSVGKEVTEESAKALAQQTLKQAAIDYAKATGKAIPIEGLTETAQQILERAQAGLSITDPQARAEYVDSFIGGAALAGALGGPGRFMERRGEIAQGQRLEQDRLAREAAAAQQAQQEEEQRRAAAQEQFKQSDDYALDVEQRFNDFNAQVKALREKAKARVEPGDLAGKAEQKEAGQQLSELVKENRDLITEYNAIKNKLPEIREKQRVAGMAPMDYMLEQAGEAPATAQVKGPATLPSDEELGFVPPELPTDAAARFVNDRIALAQAQVVEPQLSDYQSYLMTDRGMAERAVAERPAINGLSAKEQRQLYDSVESLIKLQKQAEEKARSDKMAEDMAKQDELLRAQQPLDMQPDLFAEQQAEVAADTVEAQRQYMEDLGFAPALLDRVTQQQGIPVVPVNEDVRALANPKQVEATLARIDALEKRAQPQPRKEGPPEDTAVVTQRREEALAAAKQLQELRKSDNPYIREVLRVRDAQSQALMDLQDTIEDLRIGAYLSGPDAGDGTTIHALPTKEELNKEAEAARSAYIKAVLEEAAVNRRARGDTAVTQAEAVQTAMEARQVIDELITRGQAQRGKARGMKLSERPELGLDVANLRRNVTRAERRVQQAQSELADLDAAAKEVTSKRGQFQSDYARDRAQKTLARRMLELEAAKTAFAKAPKRLVKGERTLRIGDIRSLEERPFGNYRAAVETQLAQLEEIKNRLNQPRRDERVVPQDLRTQFAPTEAARIAQERGETATTVGGEMRRRTEYVRNQMSRMKGMRPQAATVLNRAADLMDSGRATRDLLDAVEPVVETINRGQMPLARDLRAIDEAIKATEPTAREQQEAGQRALDLQFERVPAVPEKAVVTRDKEGQARVERESVESTRLKVKVAEDVGYIRQSAANFDNAPAVKKARAAVQKARDAEEAFRRFLRNAEQQRREARRAAQKKVEQQIFDIQYAIDEQRKDLKKAVAEAEADIKEKLRAANYLLAAPKFAAARKALADADPVQLGVTFDPERSPPELAQRYQQLVADHAEAQARLDALMQETVADVDNAQVVALAAHDGRVKFERDALDKLTAKLQGLTAKQAAQAEVEQVSTAAAKQRAELGAAEAQQRAAKEAADKEQQALKARLEKGLGLPKFTSQDLGPKRAIRTRIDAFEALITAPDPDVTRWMQKLEEAKAAPKDKNASRRVRYAKQQLALAEDKAAARKEALSQQIRELRAKLASHDYLTDEQRRAEKAAEDSARARQVDFDPLAHIGIKQQRATSPVTREISQEPRSLRTGSQESRSGENVPRPKGLRATESRKPTERNVAISKEEQAEANAASVEAGKAGAYSTPEMEALRMNLATVRGQIKNAQAQLVDIEKATPYRRIFAVNGEEMRRVEAVSALKEQIADLTQKRDSLSSKAAILAEELRTKRAPKGRAEEYKIARKAAKDFLELQALFKLDDADLDPDVFEIAYTPVPDTLPEGVTRIAQQVFTDAEGGRFYVPYYVFEDGRPRSPVDPAQVASLTKKTPSLPSRQSGEMAALEKIAGVPFDTDNELNGKTLAEAARIYGKRAKTGWRKQVYEAVADALDALPAGTVSGRIFVTQQSMRGRGGLYASRYGAVVVNPNASANIVLHELVHAATSGALRVNPTFNEKVDAIRKKVADWFETPEGKAFYRKHGRLGLGAKDASMRAYGLKNNHEFLAEALSNPLFQQALASIPTDKPVAKNLFKRFVDVVAEFFGLDRVGQKTVLAEAMAVSSEIFDFTKAHIIKDSAMPGVKTGRNEVFEIAINSLTNGIFPGNKPDVAPDVPVRVAELMNTTVGKQPTLVDKIMANLTGLGFRTQFVDRLAPAEKLLQQGVEKGMLDDAQLFQTSYFLRFGEQRNQFVAQAAGDGVPQLRKTAEGDYVIETPEGDHPNISKIAEILRDSNTGNEQAAERMFTLYLAAKRGEQVGFDKLNFDTPMTPADAKQINDYVAADPKRQAAFEKARKMYREYNNQLLKLAQQMDALSADDVKRLSQGDYVPYYRERGGVVELIVAGEKPMRIGNLTEQPYLKELVGGNDRILPFFTGAMQNTSMLMDLALRNKQTREMAQVLSNLGLLETRGKVNFFDGDGPTDVRRKIQFKIDGQLKYAMVTDATKNFGVPADLLVQGMQGIKTTMPAALKLMAIPSDWLRKFVTRSPVYALRQIVRDSINGWLVTGGNFTPVMSSVKELTQMVSGRSPNEMLLQRAGAISSNVFTGDTQDNERILRDIAAGKTGWQRVMAKADAFALQGDAATRAVLYHTYRKQGMTHMQALLGSLESMNFSRRGLSPSMQAMSMLVPFFNAQVQGLDVVYRSARGKSTFQQRLDVQRKLYTRGLMITAATLAYAALMQDDEAYKNATPEQRALNWFMPVPGFDEPVRIPIPFELGYIFKALPELFLNTAFGDTKASEATKAIAGMAYQTVPMGLPQAIKPALEVMTNYSLFTGAPIEYTREQGLQKAERFRENTTELSKLLGQTGLLSPIQLDYLIRGYTGGLGLALLSIADAPLSALSPSEVPEGATKKLSQYPVIGSLFQPTDGRGIIDSAYAQIEEWQQASATFNKMVAEGRRADAMKYSQEYSRQIALNSFGGSYRQQMGDLAKIKRQIAASQLSPAEKRERIDAIRQIEIALAERVRQAAQATEGE